jgi:hypothetical protein
VPPLRPRRGATATVVTYRVLLREGRDGTERTYRSLVRPAPEGGPYLSQEGDAFLVDEVSHSNRLIRGWQPK